MEFYNNFLPNYFLLFIVYFSGVLRVCMCVYSHTWEGPMHEHLTNLYPKEP